MFWFRSDAVTRGDEEGIVAVGAAWVEPRGEMYDLVSGALRLLPIPFGIILFLESFKPKEAEQMLMVAGGVAALWFCLLISYPWVTRAKRQLLFHIDGTIRMPRGRLHSFLGNKKAWNLAKLSSIQVQASEQQEDAYKERKFEVWLYFNDGSSACLTRQLLRLEAHRVSVMLSNAKDEIREMRGQLERNPYSPAMID